MVDELKTWAAVHWVLWPSIVVVLLLFIGILWWSHHQTRRSPALFRAMAISLLLGLMVIAAGIIDDLPPWFRRSSVISCLGVLLILNALLCYVVAHRWVRQVTLQLEKEKKALEKENKEVGDKVRQQIVANIVGPGSVKG